MEIVYGIILGLVQGATEFLPVSSSGHLVLAEHFFHVRQAGLAFDVFLHLGTLVGLLFYFRADIRDMLLSLAGRSGPAGDRPGRRTALMLAAATVPGGLAGILLEHAVEERFRNPAGIAAALALVGLVLLAAERFGRREVSFSRITWPQALLIGTAQACAVFPGVSRSGSTMSAALFLGLSREAAARFSFLLSGPIILGAGLVKLPEAVRAAAGGEAALYAAGFLASMLSGYLFVSFMMRFVRRHSLDVFAWYRICLAAVVFAALSIQS